MYDIWFYIFFWLMAILLAFPVLLIGFVWIFLQRFSEKRQILSLEDIDSLLLEIKNKKDFQEILKEFLQNFKSLPEDRSNLKLWLGVIEKFVASEFFDVNQVKDFENNLKSSNEEIQKNIADTLEAVLKTRKKR